MCQPPESNGLSIQGLLHDKINFLGVDKKLLEKFTAYDPIHGAILKNYIARDNLNSIALGSVAGGCTAFFMFLKTKRVDAGARLRFGLFKGFLGVAFGAQAAKMWYPSNPREGATAYAQYKKYKEWSQKRASAESDFGVSSLDEDDF